MNRIITGLIVLTLCVAVHVPRAWGAEAAGVESGGTMTKRAVKLVQPGADVQVAPQPLTGQARKQFEEGRGSVQARLSYGYGGHERYNCCIAFHGSLGDDLNKPLNIYCASEYEEGGAEICSALEEAHASCTVQLKHKLEPFKTMRPKSEELLMGEFGAMGIVVDEGRLDVATLLDSYVMRAGADKLESLSKTGPRLFFRQIDFYKIISVDDVSCRPSGSGPIFVQPRPK